MIKNNSLNVIPYIPDLLPLSEKFNSGHTFINQFLQNSDQSLDTNFGKTYVLLSRNSHRIIGYYNLGVGAINYLDGTLNLRMGGAITINYFALDKKYQKHTILKNKDSTIYLSDMLLDDCIKRIRYIATNYVGATFITLNSNEEGYHLYTRNGFMELENDMYITKKTYDYKCTSLYLCIEEDI